MPVRECSVLSLGGGFGSLAVVRSLIARELPASELCVVATDADVLETERRFAARAGHPVLGTSAWDLGAVAWYDTGLSDGWWSTTKKVVVDAFRGNEPLQSRAVTGLIEQVDWPSFVTEGWAERLAPAPTGGWHVIVRRRDGERILISAKHVHLGLGAGRAEPSGPAQDYHERYPHGHRVRGAFDGPDGSTPSVDSGSEVVAVYGDGRTADRIIDELLRSGGDDAPQVLHVCSKSRIRADDASADLWRRPELPRRRPHWFERSLYRAAQQGRFLHVRGDLRSIDQRDERLSLNLCTHAGSTVLFADRLVDATGARRGLSAEPALAGIAAQTGQAITRPERLVVDEHRAVRDLESGSGRCYVSGSLAHLPTHSAPDHPLALRLAADRISRHLVSLL